MTLALLSGLAAAAATPNLPHIFFVLVDDFGWAEVGWHRTDKGQVHTPTMDALVKDGVELNRHYVHMMCTPTRSSYQSGRLPVHVLDRLLGPCDKNGAIPRNMTGVAAKLKTAGYATHHVGKWDAGMTTPHHTPQGRGYDTALSYFGHANWMWTQHEWGGSRNNMSDIPDRDALYDFWDTDKPAKSLQGTGYEELIFRDRVHKILTEHDQSKPLYLNYCSKVAHYPLQAPKDYQDSFSFIEDGFRRTYHAMVNVLDDNLKNMTETMKGLGMWENTLMVLSSDNGGFVKSPQGDCNYTGYGGAEDSDAGHGYVCFNGEAGANNYPLRGGKYSPFEGGIRVNAFMSGGFLPQAVRGTKNDGMIHIADWYGTFCKLAGVDPTDTWAAESGLPPVDSVDVWPLVSGQNLTSPRTSILVNAKLLVTTRWKYATGTMIEAAWGGPQYPNASTQTDPIDRHNLKCPSTGCLFDLSADITERDEVSAEHPDVVTEMAAELKRQATTIWSQPHGNDPKCVEVANSVYGGFYGPFQEI
eukprot:Hpha_TRINITY_DN13003_c0_g1::TRINITY_DN13003_c0_g1_i1::g.69194::m.69194